MAEPFFQTPPPRSTGRELFGGLFVERMAARGAALGSRPGRPPATAVRVTARAAADALLRHCGAPEEGCSAAAAENRVIARRWEELPGAALRDTDDEGVDGDAKGGDRLRGAGLARSPRPSNHLPHTTGASRRVVLGKLVRGGTA